MQQFRVTNKRKTIKKASSGLITKFTIKKNSNSIQVPLFIENFSYLFCFLVTVRLVIFQIEVQLMTTIIYSQMKPNDKKNRFQGIAHVFFASTLSFRNFN